MAKQMWIEQFFAIPRNQDFCSPSPTILNFAITFMHVYNNREYVRCVQCTLRPISNGTFGSSAGSIRNKIYFYQCFCNRNTINLHIIIIAHFEWITKIES